MYREDAMDWGYLPVRIRFRLRNERDRRGEERERLTRGSMNNKTGGTNRTRFKIFSGVQVIGIALPVFS